MTIGGRTAADSRITQPNPDCTVCLGSGSDPAFGSDCTECWPPRSRFGNRVNPTTGEIIPSQFNMAKRRLRRATYWALLTAWTVAYGYYLVSILAVIFFVGVLGIAFHGARKNLPGLTAALHVRHWYRVRLALRQSLRYTPRLSKSQRSARI